MKSASTGYNEMPLKLRLPPAELFAALASQSEIAFLLESAEGPEKLARFSFVGFKPHKHVTLRNNILNINGKDTRVDNPLGELKKAIGKGKKQSSKEGFLGGAVGYFSFDYIRQIEHLSDHRKKDADYPDFEFGIFDDAIVYDHRKKTVTYRYGRENRLAEMMDFITQPVTVPSLKITGIRCDTSEAEFCDTVRKAKEHILAGDIFQVVVSKRYEIDFTGSLLSFYKNLKATNPSPYLYFLKFGECQIIGSSPENLIRVEGRQIISYATLAGTRPRGKDSEEDRLLEKDLLNDEKERAEHLMLVDLTRNDIGKVAEAGTVNVPELMTIHKFSHVQHLASLVTGTLAKGKDAYDAFNAIFPAGTVSGAPKLRAIQILNTLEKTRRGPYAGAVGYFSANGNADFAIGIRTLFATKNKAYLQTGAGIVYDSIPEKEFRETEIKAEALIAALEGEANEK